MPNFNAKSRASGMPDLLGAIKDDNKIFECWIISDCTVKEVASNEFKECQFPFKYGGETFDGCVDFIYKNGKRVKPKGREQFSYHM